MADEQTTGTQPVTPPVNNNGGEKLVPQSDVDRIVQERLERERSKAAKDAAKQREEAEREALLKAGEWEKLAKSHEAKVTELSSQVGELEAVKAANDRMSKALSKQVTALTANVPEPVQKLLSKLDPVEQLEWLADNAAAIGAAAPKPAQQGVPASPAPAALRAPAPGDLVDRKRRNQGIDYVPF